MLKKILIAILVILIIGFVSAFIRGCDYQNEKDTTPNSTDSTEKQNIIDDENIENILNTENQETEKKN